MAVTTFQLKVVKKAVAIRLKNGETLEDILESYTKLSDDQKDEIRLEYQA